MRLPSASYFLEIKGIFSLLGIKSAYYFINCEYIYQICRWYHFNWRKRRGTKNFLIKVKEESEKAGLKLNIQKTKIMASELITLWQTDGENVETVSDFIFLGSKINAYSDCSHEIKRHLLLGRTAMTNPDNILKSRDVTLPTNVHLVKAMVFPVVVHGCEGWTIKEAKELTLSNCGAGEDSWESPGHLGDLISPSKRKLTLNIHWKDCFWSWSYNIWPPDAKGRLIGKDPDAGKDWGEEEKGKTEDEMAGWHHWLNGHEFEQT